jgi:hypothetical protein
MPIDTTISIVRLSDCFDFSIVSIIRLFDYADYPIVRLSDCFDFSIIPIFRLFDYDVSLSPPSGARAVKPSESLKKQYQTGAQRPSNHFQRRASGNKPV